MRGSTMWQLACHVVACRVLAWAVLLVPLVTFIEGQQQQGCECQLATTGDHWGVVDGRECAVRVTLDGTRICYDPYYGFEGCKSYDEGLLGCAGESPPGFCSERWCYVDLNRCPERYRNDVLPSYFFPGHSFFFSYISCEAYPNDNPLAAWGAENAVTSPWSTAAEFIAVFSEHLAAFETAFNLAENTDTEDCVSSSFQHFVSDTCPCGTCLPPTWPEQDLQWSINWSTLAVDFHRFSFWNQEGAKNDKVYCAQQAGGMEMLKIAQQEYTASSRPASMFYHDQSADSTLIWPTCSGEEKAVPWARNVAIKYISGWGPTSAGPTDLVIAVDISAAASPVYIGRAEAITAIVDYLKLLVVGIGRFAVFGFSDTIRLYNESMVLWDATEENTNRIAAWLLNLEPRGRANISKAFETAAELHRWSRATEPVGCRQVVEFIVASSDAEIRTENWPELLPNISIYATLIGGLHHQADIDFWLELSCQTGALMQVLGTPSADAVFSASLLVLIFFTSKATADVAEFVAEESGKYWACRFTFAGAIIKRGLFCIDIGMMDPTDDQMEAIQPLFESTGLCLPDVSTFQDVDDSRRILTGRQCTNATFEVPKRQYIDGPALAMVASRQGFCKGRHSLEEAIRLCDVLTVNCSVVVSNADDTWQFCFGRLSEVVAAFGIPGSTSEPFARSFLIEGDTELEREYLRQIAESSDGGNCLRKAVDLGHWLPANLPDGPYTTPIRVAFPADTLLRIVSHMLVMLFRDVYSLPVEEYELNPGWPYCTESPELERCSLLKNPNFQGFVYKDIENLYDVVASLDVGIDQITDRAFYREHLVDVTPGVDNTGKTWYNIGATWLIGQYGVYPTPRTFTTIPRFIIAPYWTEFTNLTQLIAEGFAGPGDINLTVSKEELLKNCIANKANLTFPAEVEKCDSEGRFVPPWCKGADPECRVILHNYPHVQAYVVESLVYILKLPFIIMYIGSKGMLEVDAKWDTLPPMLVARHAFGGGPYVGNASQEIYKVLHPEGLTICEGTFGELCAYAPGAVTILQSRSSFESYPATMYLTSRLRGLPQSDFIAIRVLAGQAHDFFEGNLTWEDSVRAATCLKLRVQERTQDSNRWFGTCTSATSEASAVTQECTASPCSEPTVPYYPDNSGFLCVCPAGTYQEGVGDYLTCVTCAEGFYCDGQGGPPISCVSQFNGTSSKGGATRLDQCVCDRGKQLDPPFVECTPCPPGYIKDRRGTTLCLEECPTHSGTNGRTGSISIGYCQCDAGYFVFSANPWTCNFCVPGADCLGGMNLAAMDAIIASSNLEDLEVQGGPWLLDVWATHNLPVSKSGFYPVQDTLPTDPSAVFTPLFVECFRKSSCDYGSKCLRGYEGYMCLECSDGFANFGVEGQCYQCHDVESWTLFLLQLFFGIPIFVFFQWGSLNTAKNAGFLTLICMKLLWNHLGYIDFVVKEGGDVFINSRWKNEDHAALRETLRSYIENVVTPVWEFQKLASASWAHSTGCVLRSNTWLIWLPSTMDHLSSYTRLQVRRLIVSLVYPVVWVALTLLVCFPYFYFYVRRRREALQATQRQRAYVDWLQQLTLLGETPFLQAYSLLAAEGQAVVERNRVCIWRCLPSYSRKRTDRLCVEAFLQMDAENSGRLSQAAVERIIMNHLDRFRLVPFNSSEDIEDIVDRLFKDDFANDKPADIPLDEEGYVTSTAFVHWLVTTKTITDRGVENWTKVSFGGWTIARNYVKDTIPMFFILLYVIYPATIDGFLTFLFCQTAEDDSKTYHRRVPIATPELECYGSDHLPILILASCGLLVYGIAMPLVAMCLVRANAGSNAGRQYYGWFFNGYDVSAPGMYWDSLIHFRKLILAALWRLPADQSTRYYLLLSVMLLLLIANERFTPFSQQRENLVNRLETRSLGIASLSLLGTYVTTTSDLPPAVVTLFFMAEVFLNGWFILSVFWIVIDDFRLWCFFQYNRAQRLEKEEGENEDEKRGVGDPLKGCPEPDEELELFDEKKSNDSNDSFLDAKELALLTHRLVTRFRRRVDDITRFVTFGRVRNLTSYFEHPWVDFKKVVARRQKNNLSALTMNLDPDLRAMTVGAKDVGGLHQLKLATNKFIARGQGAAGKLRDGMGNVVLAQASRSGLLSRVKSLWGRRSTGVAEQPGEDEDEDIDDEDVGEGAEAMPDATNQVGHVPSATLLDAGNVEMAYQLSDGGHNVADVGLAALHSKKHLGLHWEVRGTAAQAEAFRRKMIRVSAKHWRWMSRGHRQVDHGLFDFAAPAKLLLRNYIAGTGGLSQMATEALLYLLQQAAEAQVASQVSEADKLSSQKIAAAASEVEADIRGGPVPQTPKPHNVLHFLPSLTMLENFQGRVQKTIKNVKKELTMSWLDIYLCTKQAEDFRSVVHDLNLNTSHHSEFHTVSVKVGVDPDEMRSRGGVPRRTFVTPQLSTARLHGVVEKHGRTRKKEYAKEALGEPHEEKRRMKVLWHIMRSWLKTKQRERTYRVAQKSMLVLHDMVSQAWRRRLWQIQIASSPWLVHQSDFNDDILHIAERNLHDQLGILWRGATMSIERSEALYKEDLLLTPEARKCLLSMAHPGGSLDILGVVTDWMKKLDEKLPQMLRAVTMAWIAFQEHESTLMMNVDLPTCNDLEIRHSVARKVVRQVLGSLVGLEPLQQVMPILHELKQRVRRQTWRFHWTSCRRDVDKFCGICGHAFRVEVCGHCRGGYEEATLEDEKAEAALASLEGWEASHIPWLLNRIEEARDLSASRMGRNGVRYLEKPEADLVKDWKAKVRANSLIEIRMVPVFLDRSMSVGEWVLRHALARRTNDELRFLQCVADCKSWSRNSTETWEKEPQEANHFWFHSIMEDAEAEHRFNYRHNTMPDEEDVLHILVLIERKMRLREAKVDSTIAEQALDAGRSIEQVWDKTMKTTSTGQLGRQTLPTDHFVPKDETGMRVLNKIMAKAKLPDFQSLLRKVKPVHRPVVLAMIVRQVTETCRQLSDWVYAIGINRERELLCDALFQQFSVRQEWGGDQKLNGLTFHTPRLATPYSYELEDKRIFKHKVFSSLWEFRAATTLRRTDYPDDEVNDRWKELDRVREDWKEMDKIQRVNVATQNLRDLWRILEGEAYKQRAGRASNSEGYRMTSRPKGLRELLERTLDKHTRHRRTHVVEQLAAEPVAVQLGILMKFERLPEWKRTLELGNGKVLNRDMSEWFLKQVRLESAYSERLLRQGRPMRRGSTITNTASVPRTPTGMFTLNFSRRKTNTSTSGENVMFALDHDKRTRRTFTSYTQAGVGDEPPRSFWNHIWVPTSTVALQTDAVSKPSTGSDANLLSNVALKIAEHGILDDLSFKFTKLQQVNEVVSSDLHKAKMKKETLENALLMIYQHSGESISVPHDWMNWIRSLLRKMDEDNAKVYV